MITRDLARKTHGSYARLRRSMQAAFGIQIRMTPLPGALADALRPVDDLAR